MKDRVEHTFTATHAHDLPPDGRMGESHSHDWKLVFEVSGPLHADYGWVYDFFEIERLISGMTEGVVNLNSIIENPTTERALIHFTHELAFLLPSGGPVITRAELWETETRCAIREPALERDMIGPER